MTALGARAPVDPLADLVVDDVGAIHRRPGLRIELLPHVLEDGLLVTEILARLAIELPEHAVLADREHQILSARIDEHALEDDVEVERFTGRVRVVPRQLAGIEIERDGGARVERLVERVHPAAHRHPRLRLRRTPVGEIEIRIVAAGDPRLAAGAEQVRQAAPRIAAGFTDTGDRVESPQLLAGLGVVGADEALLLDVLLTAAHALDDFSFGDERTARTAAAIGHCHVPGNFAGLRVERHEMRVAHRDIELVVVQRDTARRGVAAETLLPDQIAGLAIDRLDDPAGVIDEDRPVARERRGLIRAAFGHRGDPDQLQILCVVTRDLCQRAVVRREVIAADRQPVSWRGIAKILVGDGGEVLDFARDGETGDWRLRLTAPAATTAARGWSGRSSCRCRCLCSGLCGWSRRGGCSANHDRCCGGERCRARRSSVRLQDERDDVHVGVGRQCPGSVRRHRRLDQAEQIARVARAPAADERRPGERRIAHEIRAVTAGAVRLERGTAGVGLFGGKRTCRWRLLSRDAQNAEREHCGKNKEEWLTQTHLPPHVPNDPNDSNDPNDLFEKPTPEIAAIWSGALLAVELDVKLALPQRLDLRRGQIDRSGERATRALADREVGNRGAARALGHALMQPRDRGRPGEPFERAVDGELAAAERAGCGALAGDVDAIVGTRRRHPAKPRREFLSALRGERDRAGHERGGDRHCHDALSQCHSHSSGGVVAA